MTAKKETRIVKEREIKRNEDDDAYVNPHKKRIYTEEEKAFKRKTLEKARARRSELANIRKFEKDEKNKEIDKKLENIKKVKEQEQAPKVEVVEEEEESEEEEIKEEPKPKPKPKPVAKPPPLPTPTPKVKKVIKKIIEIEEEEEDDEEEEEEIIVKKIIKKQPAKPRDLYQLSNEDMLRRHLHQETKSRVLSNLFNY